ncbi:MAG TPA: DMT family transporter [Gemmatimonadales bacterium]|nr:DMT family transporter [Gemmatimonadales bacterium]
MAYVLALLSAGFYGAADFTGGLVTRRAAAIPVVLLSQASGLVLVALALPLLPAATPRTADLWWGAIAGLTGGVGVALLYYALSIGTMSVVAPTTAVAAVALPVVTSIALGERPSAIAIAGILLGVVSIVMVSLQSTDRTAAQGARTGVGLALLAGIGFGLFLLTLAQTRPEAGMWPLLTDRIASVALFAILAAVRRRSLRIPAGLTALALGGGALDMIANALYLLAVRIGPLSPVVTLSSLYPASTVLLARGILGERLSAWQTAGVLTALVALMLIVSG